MSIELVAPPKDIERFSYKEIMQKVVEADGQWVRVSLDEIAGDTNMIKQTRIWQGAYSRRLKIQTTVQEGFFYVRLRKGAR
jgi:hypothetical protein